MNWRTWLDAGLRVAIVACSVSPTFQEPLFDDSVALSTHTANMIHAQAFSGGALLDGGRMLVVGGNKSLLNDPQKRAELDNISAGTWTAGLLLAVARFGYSVARLADGQLFGSGGGNSNEETTVMCNGSVGTRSSPTAVAKVSHDDRVTPAGGNGPSFTPIATR